MARQGRRQSENTSAAAAITSHATQRGHAREQQHRERGAQVVEDRADDEVQVGWDALAAHPQPAAAGPSAPGQSKARLPSMPSDRSQNGTDAVGMRLLGELQADARLAKTRSSAAAWGCRRRRWRSGWRAWRGNGVIRGYRAELDPAQISCTLSVVLRIGRSARAEEGRGAGPARPRWSVPPHAGDDCYIMRAWVRDVQEHGAALTFAPYGQTTTSIVQPIAVPRRALAL